MLRSGVLLVAAAPCFVAAQMITPPDPDVLLTARFVTPLSYASALAKLDSFYQEQVGRKLAIAFPEIAPNVHYEIWHDMWVLFEPAGEKLGVTVRRQTDGVTSRLAKGWILDLAGRIEGAQVEFKDGAALQHVESDVYASRKDLARAFAPDSSFKPVVTWQHAGLIVSASPPVSVTLAPAGLHGIHRLTVLAETAAAAKQTLAKIVAASLRPCICAAYSETAEIEEEIHRTASEKHFASQQVFILGTDPKVAEDKLRNEPEMQKRIAAAAGMYAIKYRVDKAYSKVNVRWAELTGYSREDGKFESVRALGTASAAAPRMPAQPGAQLTLRTRLDALKPGAYRIDLEGEPANGEKTRIDVRDFWFDGKSFEEL